MDLMEEENNFLIFPSMLEWKFSFFPNHIFFLESSECRSPVWDDFEIFHLKSTKNLKFSKNRKMTRLLLFLDGSNLRATYFVHTCQILHLTVITPIYKLLHFQNTDEYQLHNYSRTTLSTPARYYSLHKLLLPSNNCYPFKLPTLISSIGNLC